MILFTGTSGKVGGEVVRQLKSKNIPFRAGLRSPEKAEGFLAVRFDFDRLETFAPVLEGIDRLFLLSSGGTEREISVIDAAKKAGVVHVIKLSVWRVPMKRTWPLAAITE